MYIYIYVYIYIYIEIHVYVRISHGNGHVYTEVSYFSPCVSQWHHPGSIQQLNQWWYTYPSEIYDSLGMYGKIKFMFQTTNQKLIPPSFLDMINKYLVISGPDKVQ